MTQRPPQTAAEDIWKKWKQQSGVEISTNYSRRDLEEMEAAKQWWRSPNNSRRDLEEMEAAKRWWRSPNNSRRDLEEMEAAERW